MDRFTRVFLLLVAAATTVLTVGSLADREWLPGALFAVAATISVVSLVRGGPTRSRAHRAAASKAAVDRCGPDRVRALTAAESDEIQAIRALRRAEPDLVLGDAVGLVRAARAG